MIQFDFSFRIYKINSNEEKKKLYLRKEVYINRMPRFANVISKDLDIFFNTSWQHPQKHAVRGNLKYHLAKV